MARYSGKIGFIEIEEVSKGVYEEVVTDRPYFGDVIRDIHKQTIGDSINSDLRVNNSISIVADMYAEENFMRIAYVWWVGNRWTVTSVQIERPRLILTVGELYNAG